MTGSMADDELEARLRGALAGLRPAEAAGPSLRARIERIPASNGQARFPVRVLRILARPGPMAILVTAGAIAIVAFALANVGPRSGVGSGNAPHQGSIPPSKVRA